MEPDQVITQAEKAAWSINCPYHLRDEVRDAAIVGAWEGTLSWKPEKGVPEAAWVYKTAKWAALDFLATERKQLAYSLDECTQEPVHTPITSMEGWWDVLCALNKLDQQTNEVLIAFALGYPMAALSKRFRRSGPQLVSNLEVARAQLRAIAIL